MRELADVSRNLDDEPLLALKKNGGVMQTVFDGGGGVEDWNGADETFNVTLELVHRGYTEPQIA